MDLGIFKRVIFVCAFITSLYAVAAPIGFTKGHSTEELQNALAINQLYEIQNSRTRATPVTGKPVLETDDFQYLLLSGETFEFQTEEMVELHRIFSENLPSDMTLVVVTEKSNAAQVKANFSKWLASDRFVIASGDNLGNITWSRDSYPYPVYKDQKKTVELVAHKYFRTFNANDLITKTVKAKNINSQKFVYVGGNLLAAENGDCFAVDSPRIFGLSTATFQDSFRCKTITRLPYVAGIGDVDEVMKALPNKIILTNQKSYRSIFEKMGYTVTLLPELYDTYRTYANSVILGNTVFMPTYDDPLDQTAEAVYASFGYKVIGIPSSYLSDRMNGSLHCLTMTYPKMDLATLLRQLSLEQLN